MKILTIGEKFDSKFDFRETCFGIVVHKSKILLVKKNNQYSLVGGGIEKNETFEDCLQREFIEEAGMTISHIKPLICIDCFWLAAGKYPMESKANIFVVDVDLNNIINPLEEGHIPEWVDIEKAKVLLPLPYHKEALDFYLKTNNQNLTLKDN